MQTTHFNALLDQQFIGVDALRRELAEILAKLGSNKGPVVVTQHGNPRAVLVDITSYMETQETLHDLQNHALISNIYSGIREIDRGEKLTLKEIKRKLRL